MSNELVVTPTATPRPRPEADGSAAPVLTDHAFFMRTGKRRTWQGLTVADRDAIPALRPTAGAVLAGQTVVDAFTAYRMADGTIAVFRPDSHIKRLNNGARRLALPQVDFDRVWTSVRALVELDQAWLPGTPGAALQLRAVLAADGTGLTPSPADDVLFYVLASVADPAAAAGKPVRAMTLDGYVRAWPGGTGDVNDAGSLAAGVVPGEVAANYGYDHVLWLDGPQGRFVQQIGNLNAFFVIDGVLTTPALDRSVLPGVTRDSVVKLARDSGTRVVERPVELAEVLKGIADGSVTEVFATGTGAGVVPVTALGHQGEEYRLASEEAGPVTARFRDLLDGIHRGEAIDRFGWMRRLTEVAPVHA
ncbi:MULTISPECIES: aminotransferase class IV [Streptomyces]|uniref:Branched-chain amino acid aminotransferase n=1 Tax=Streptomyces venezuelae (strain ATCC 10712 / CBS 650.69 / DSM 40230 / JCM 4526 / NBRC 13096 / PD 04745) TaxID=953739 RepID=F2RKH0_STRVP|nr:aminotransferase class IV [Streptomyces venezuelae]APE25667.1 branched-chain amino acid aminotransferase [Streptomyces venezuelae]QES03002.1 branched-chain amino acid aminotransferase [Streptomyces venezuelae ATCC 10712]CCA60326.1 Branched-chain amino acid aminotransferase [Streptomyces venezuelae ATCC 10712]